MSYLSNNLLFTCVAPNFVYYYVILGKGQAISDKSQSSVRELHFSDLLPNLYGLLL